MDEIDKPFRPKWDFYLVWVAFAVVAGIFHDKIAYDLPWYSKMASVVIFSLFATLFFYVPVLLLRQAIRSGARGRRVLFQCVLVLGPGILICGCLLFAGLDNAAKGLVFPLLLIGCALILLEDRRHQRKS